jgi:hypothetical protein
MKTSSPDQFAAADLALILETLRNRSMLSREQLTAAIINKFDQAYVIDEILSFLLEIGHVDFKNNAFIITEEGNSWMAEEEIGLSVEQEDPVENGSPIIPYEVAKLKMEPRNMSVFQMLRMIDKHKNGEAGGIKLNPDFQRAFVWDEQKQSRLIESILIRIPLPAFYIDATNQIEWNVVDGLQRLTTLYRYCRGNEFELKGLQFLTELNGCRFPDLPAQYRVLIEDDTQLQFYNLMPGTPASAKFTIFSRVNTGGLQLTAQEIRHALNQGKITTVLADLAKHSIFITATDGAVESLRMSDREVILRALAFMHLGVEAYRRYNELDEFLLAAMEELNNIPDEQLKLLKLEFLDSLVKVRAVFGRYSFRKFYYKNGRRSPFNKALFEAWVFCVRPYSVDNLKNKKEKIMELFISKISKPWEGLPRSISSGTSAYISVATRFSEIEKILLEANLEN